MKKAFEPTPGSFYPSVPAAFESFVPPSLLPSVPIFEPSVPAGKGMHPEAVDRYRRSVAALGAEEKNSQPLVYLPATYAKIPERQGDARVIFARLEAKNEFVSPALIAFVYAVIGDNDKARMLR